MTSRATSLLLNITNSGHAPYGADLSPTSQHFVAAAQDARAVRMVGRKVFL